MESKSKTQPSNRQGKGPRGGKSGNGHPNHKRSGNQQNRNRNRNRSRNRNQNRNRNRNRRRRRPEPEPTAGQKILAFLTFGKLGKKGRGKKKSPPKKKFTKNQGPRKTAHSNGSSKPTPKRGGRRQRPVEVTTSRLYVGNLSYEANESDLEELFKGAGIVMSAEVVTNARTQQSKGFAFVEMGTVDEARRAVEILNDQDFMGRRLNINGARSEGPRDTEAREGNDAA